MTPFPSERLKHFSRSGAIVAALAVSLCLYALETVSAQSRTEPTPYEVVWTTPSNDWTGSMPLGNGEIGVNARLDGAGNLSLLIARTDAWDDYGRLVKIGGVRVSLFGESEEIPENKSQPFLQSLDTRTGIMSASSGAVGYETRWRLWVDAKRPVIVVEIDSDYYLTPRLALDLWRTEPAEPLADPEVSDLFWGTQNAGSVYPDEILTGDALEAAGRIGWRHVNTKTPFFDQIAAVQGTTDAPGRVNPLAGRIFGAQISAAAPVYQDERTLYSQVGLRHRFEIAVTSTLGKTPDEWLAESTAVLADAATNAIDVRRAEHTLWWSDFAARSRILISKRPTFERKPPTESTLFNTTEQPLGVGLDANGSSRFRGELQHFRLYDDVLTDRQIQKIAGYCRLDPEDIRLLSKYTSLADSDLLLLAAYYKLTSAEIAEMAKEYTPEERKLYALTDNITYHDIRVLQTIKNFSAITPYFRYDSPGHTRIRASSKWKFPDGFTLEIMFRTPEPDKNVTDKSAADKNAAEQTAPNPTAPNRGFSRLFDKMPAAGGAGFALDMTPEGKLRLMVGADAENYSEFVADGRWHHVALTVDSFDRTRLFLDGSEIVSERGRRVLAGDETLVVTCAYLLQRYLDACAGRGNYPIKFNGSLFTVPTHGKPYGPDYRRWGPGYWWQNTRLPYISKPAAGDFDLMKPLFAMYAQMLPVCRYRTTNYFGFDGAYYPECLYPWGDVFPETYGPTPWNERENRLQETGWHKYEWVGGLELLWLQLAYYEYTLDDAFLAETLLPTADSLLAFFDHYYKTGEDGKLIMTPAQALETWWTCTNPMPEIAGLTAVTAGLLALDPAKTTEERRAAWSAFSAKIPPIPTRIDPVTGSPLLAAAASFADKNNIENPELYAVFPFRLFTFDKPNVDLALRALGQRETQGPKGWQQDELFLTTLGQTEEAHRLLVERARTKNAHSRFPIFWGPNYDWVPDQDHGGVLSCALQQMVMQCEGDKIYLLPAFPKEWDVDFRLHAPKNTVVSGKTVRGKIVSLTVTPPERAKDVILAKPPKSERF